MQLQEQIFYGSRTGLDWALLPVPGGGKIIANHGEKKHYIPLPGAAGEAVLCASASRGYVWAVSARVDPLHLHVALNRCALAQAGAGWECFATINPANGIPAMLIPLADGVRFLGIAQSIAFVDPVNNQVSYAGIFQFKNGNLVFSRCVAMPFERISSIARHGLLTVEDGSGVLPSTGPLVKDGGASPEPSADFAASPEPSADFAASPDSVLLPSLWLPSISPDHVAVSAATAGVIWLYDLQSGQLQKTVNLFNLKEEDLSGLERVSPLILGTSFAPSGNLIIASRQPDIVFHALKLNAFSGKREAKDRAFSSISAAFDSIQWWELDPATGALLKLDDPLGFPAHARSFRAQARFRFLIDSQGAAQTNASLPWLGVKKRFGAAPEVRAVVEPGVPVSALQAPAVF